MPVRVRYKVDAAISSNSLEERDLGNVRWEVVTDKPGEGGGWKTLLVAGATDVQLPLDSIAACKLLIIRTNAKDPNQVPNEVRIKLDSTMAVPLLIVPLQDTKEGHFLITTNSISALYASNLGSVDMELTILAAGD